MRLVRASRDRQCFIFWSLTGTHLLVEKSSHCLLSSSSAYAVILAQVEDYRSHASPIRPAYQPFSAALEASTPSSSLVILTQPLFISLLSSFMVLRANLIHMSLQTSIHPTVARQSTMQNAWSSWQVILIFNNAICPLFRWHTLRCCPCFLLITLRFTRFESRGHSEAGQSPLFLGQLRPVPAPKTLCALAVPRLR